MILSKMIDGSSLRLILEKSEGSLLLIFLVPSLKLMTLGTFADFKKNYLKCIQEDLEFGDLYSRIKN